jgi:hypothetical protein
MYAHDYVWGCQDRRSLPEPPMTGLFEAAVRLWWLIRSRSTR